METGVDEHQALKDLAVEFEISNDPVIFVKIILKVDNLLKYTISRLRASRPYLQNVEYADLYQTALLGLYRALAKVKQQEPGGKLVYNICRYVANEILKENKDRPVNKTQESFENVIRRELVDNTKVYADLEAEFIRDRFRKLISAGVINEDEFDILKRHFVNEMSYRSIARQDGCSVGTISKKVRDSLNRLRVEFRRRHWEDG